MCRRHSGSVVRTSLCGDHPHDSSPTRLRRECAAGSVAGSSRAQGDGFAGSRSVSDRYCADLPLDGSRQAAYERICCAAREPKPCSAEPIILPQRGASRFLDRAWGRWCDEATLVGSLSSAIEIDKVQVARKRHVQRRPLWRGLRAERRAGVISADG